MAGVQGLAGHHLAGQIIHLETGKVLQFDELMEQLNDKQLIFIGEVHNNPDHHLMEVQLLQAVMTRLGVQTVAMEFFERGQQEAIQRYLGGATTEAQFLEEVDWRKRWGFDYYLYRPLIQEIKERKAKLVAINAPRELVRKVAREGLDSLAPGERNQLPQKIDLSNSAHREFVRDAYEKHDRNSLSRFDYFYQAQCVWEDTMAENVARELEEGKKVVVFSGNGHVVYNFGIPDRTASRISVRMATIMLYPLGSPLYLERGTADYVWLTRDCP